MIRGFYMKKEKKIILSSLIAAVIIGVFFVIRYIGDDREFINATVDTTPVITKTQSTNPSDQTTEINIGLIGDSWVAGEKLDPFIEKQIQSYGISANVTSFGHPGAKSRDILINLLSDSSNPHSSNTLLNDDNIEYVIILAGVNDTAGHIGTDFFVHHMTELVKTINTYNKTPIILEVPEYGIEEPERSKSALKHNIYRVLFDNNKTDVIQDYRDALTNELNSTDLNYEIIPFTTDISDFHENIDLYKDQFHLNEEGNAILGTYLGDHLVKEVSN